MRARKPAGQPAGRPSPGGRPMECRDAQFYLRFRRPASDELGPEVAADLDQHLAGCPHCATEARSASAFDAALSTAMRNVAIPTGLRNRIVAHVAEKRGT